MSIKPRYVSLDEGNSCEGENCGEEEFVRFDGEVPEWRLHTTQEEEYDESLDNLDDDDDDSIDFRLEGEESEVDIPNLEFQDIFKKNNKLLEEILKGINELISISRNKEKLFIQTLDELKEKVKNME
jgi:hypothetical protein